MKYRMILFLAFNIILGNSIFSQEEQQFFQDADLFFKTFVTDGQVDYKAVKKDESLTTRIDQIAHADITQMDIQTKKAFFINAYNLLVIQAVIDRYPIKSVLDTDGFFDQEKHLVAGKRITLDQLEKEWLFGLEKDPRFHFVLVCGAKGCPQIAPFSYLPTELEEQLTNQTRAALNDPGFIRVDRKTAALSQIFQWYANDFGKNPGEIISFINGYRKTPIPVSAKVEYYTYDWSLNDI